MNRPDDAGSDAVGTAPATRTRGVGLAVAVVSFDFGNTLVRVERAGLRAVVEAMAAELVRRRTVPDAERFLEIWAEERDRQFLEEVPAFREVDLPQRVVRVLARTRGMTAPATEARWDDAAAARLVDLAEVRSAVETYSEGFVATIQAVPEAGAVLAGLAARGFRLGILSNWPLAATIDRYIEARGWAPLLDAVIVSERIGTIKPHPEIFRRAAEILGAPPERILHVGDDWAADVVGGARAGWLVAYLRGRQGDTPLPTSAPGSDVTPDLVVDSLSEIEPAISLWRGP